MRQLDINWLVFDILKESLKLYFPADKFPDFIRSILIATLLYYFLL